MDRDALTDERTRLRGEWRRAREERLSYRDDLRARGLDRARIGKQPHYRKLAKEQQRLTTLLRHIDIKLERIRTREHERDDRKN